MSRFIDATIAMAGLQNKVDELVEINTRVFLLNHPRIAKELSRVKNKKKAFEWGVKHSPTFKNFARSLNAI